MTARKYRIIRCQGVLLGTDPALKMQTVAFFRQKCAQRNAVYLKGEVRFCQFVDRYPAKHLINGLTRFKIERFITEAAFQRCCVFDKVVYRNDLTIVECRFYKYIGGMDMPQNINLNIALFFKFPGDRRRKPLAIFEPAPWKFTELHTIFTLVTNQYFPVVVNQDAVYTYVKMTVHHRTQNYGLNYDSCHILNIIRRLKKDYQPI